LIVHGQAVRDAQRLYFATRTAVHLQRAKAVEKNFDQVLKLGAAWLDQH
jgi:hypothetical protein